MTDNTQKNNCPFRQAFDFIKRLDRFEERSSKVSIFVGVYEKDIKEAKQKKDL